MRTIATIAPTAMMAGETPPLPTPPLPLMLHKLLPPLPLRLLLLLVEPAASASWSSVDDIVTLFVYITETRREVLCGAE